MSFEALGRKSVLQTMKEIFADQPGRPKPVIDQAPPKAVPVSPAPPANGLEVTAGALIESGMRFLESLAAIVKTSPAGVSKGQLLEQSLSSLVSQDKTTGRKTLSIPLPVEFDGERLSRAIAGVLGAFGR